MAAPPTEEKKTADGVSSVWEFDMVEVISKNKKWKCHWCKKEISWNATKARFHLAKAAGFGIKAMLCQHSP